jgi:hypothetical protein
MTQDEIMTMARQAGFGNYTFEALSMFEVFAKLVAQHEREACAKVCEKWTPTDADGVCDVADAIRERGQA